MTKNGFRIFFFICAFLLGVSLSSADNMISDPGFETKQNPPWISGQEKRTKTVTDAEHIHSGKTAVYFSAFEDEASACFKDWELNTSEATGINYRFSLFAKGRGVLQLGYTALLKFEDGKTESVTGWGDEKYTLAGDSWEKCSVTFSCPDFYIYRMFPAFRLLSKDDYLYMDDLEMEKLHDPETTISLNPPHLTTMDGAVSKIKVSVVKNNKSLAQINVQVMRPDKVLSKQTDQNGEFDLEITADKSYRMVTQLPPPYYNTTHSFIDVIGKELYGKFDDIAKEIRIETPLHLLFIGDSLTDLHRGENYVDKLCFWLNLHNPRKVSFRNAGIRGDYITRTLERMTKSVPASYHPEIYEGMFNPPPDIVFIFMGHNDTKLSSSSDYTKPMVDAVAAEDAYRQIINYIKNQCNAKIVLMSPSSSNYSICKANADKSLKEGRGHNLYGKPEQLEKYIGILQVVAEQNGVEYLDVYSPSKEHPDKPCLFSPTDGVHLSPDGERFVALQLLKYFADKYNDTGTAVPPFE